jgi:REP element-mobilizing transposase RayT
MIADLSAMKSQIITEWPQFFTATNLEWKKLLKPEKYKDLVVDSLRFLVNHRRIILYAFVIMDNHVHLIWQMHAGIAPEALQRDFLKYTAQKIKADLQKSHPLVLEQFRIDSVDRIYQFWERNSFSIELRSHPVFLQKLEYIHWNPVRAGLCAFPEEYKYSSARFYTTGIDDWGFLTHYSD